MTVDSYVFCPLEPSAYLGRLTADSTSFMQLLESQPLDTPVATCGDWDLAALATHVGWVHRWATVAMQTAAMPDRGAVERPASQEELLDWFTAGTANLLETLSDIDPTGPTWHPFAPPQLAGLWPRRLAHETTIHLLDAQLACSDKQGVDAVMASDGIDEYLTVTLPRVLVGDGATSPTTTLHIHCTDVEGEWLIVPSPDGLIITREHAKGDAALRGPAGALLADLWGRRGALGDIDIAGDTDVAASWLAIGGN
jgi:uncharacterized protein (TIGR03083 family)